jgi:hypothetical protein
MTNPTDDLLAERAKTHGDYATHAYITQELKRVMAEAGNDLLIPAQREALDMIAHKIGRILAGNPHYQDHWDDIAGYARLVAKELASLNCPPA